MMNVLFNDQGPNADCRGAHHFCRGPMAHSLATDKTRKVALLEIFDCPQYELPCELLPHANA